LIHHGGVLLPAQALVPRKQGRFVFGTGIWMRAILTTTSRRFAWSARQIAQAPESTAIKIRNPDPQACPAAEKMLEKFTVRIENLVRAEAAMLYFHKN
jgi:hypothetical protein